VDVDGFKSVNDRLGHVAGDHLLQEIGRRLKKTVRDDDTVGRLGGDEFAIILNSATDHEGVLWVVKRLLDSLQQPFFYNHVQVDWVSATIGISLSPQDGYEPDELLMKADEAMYYARKTKNAQYAFYSMVLQDKD